MDKFHLTSFVFIIKEIRNIKAGYFIRDNKGIQEKKEEALRAYADQKTWAKKALVNIAKAGYFSSDRTIEEYNRDIWHL